MSPDGANMRKGKVDEFFEKVLEAFGNNDVTKFLEDADGVVSPDMEWELMLKGVPVQVNPKENLLMHYVTHVAKKLELDRDGQQVPPDTLAALINHISDTALLVQEMVAQPEAFTEEIGRRQVMAQSSARPGGANLGQNLPASRGAVPTAYQEQGMMQ